MRKIFAVIALAAILLSLLSGCSTRPESAETTSSPIQSGISPEEILNNLVEMLEPLADQFEMTQQPKEILEGGKTCYPARVTDKILNRGYDILIYCTQSGDAETVLLMAERSTSTELNFPVLSFYMYKSINLLEMNADDFYAHFNMLTEQPDGSLTADGWRALTTTTDGHLTFGLTFMP